MNYELSVGLTYLIHTNLSQIFIIFSRLTIEKKWDSIAKRLVNYYVINYVWTNKAFL